MAFDALFNNFTPPNDAAAAARQDFLLRSRKSVLDLVGGSLQKLTSNPQLGTRRPAAAVAPPRRDPRPRAADLRSAPPATTATCQKLPAPGADPALGGNQGVDAAGENTYATNLGYSGEEERAKVFCDLVHMALTCDLTRVVSLQFTMFQSHLNMYPLTGQPLRPARDRPRRRSRQQGDAGVSKGIAWHMKHFAYLMAKLRDTPEGGGSLLDNCALVFLHEGGHGLDTATGKTNSSHSTENMACLIAGRAGGLKGGQHVVATGKHPANVLITAMNAVGVAGSSLGEVSGNIPALLG